MREGRWIGVDSGTRWVGVAVGDAASKMAMPLKTLESKNDAALFKALARVASENGARGFVVGLPLNMDGSEGPACKLARAFAAKLAAAAKLPVEFVDERLTSFDAEGKLIEAGLKPSERKQRVHAVSAALILQAYFEKA
jgi:putative Holliday junction resolvase